MRLTAIKLAGFKSFVDPTTFFVPTNLTGIVGPNGCGKSNIIDAARWVMGEASAKVLRGESMADVIFSGSSARKPVGTATVELIFDNSEGRVGGEFAGYNEISVKRQVSRDGISNYFLNGTRCRRKDIRDLFLGTGLGSRSYSIIEQGMISQIVDARPEDIRAHLEEAAGISKYKERRRETENRIHHTRENLARLNDLREEVGNHLNKLKRQARAAERYKKYKQQARELESKVLALDWTQRRAEIVEREAALKALETELQAHLAEQRGAESKLEQLRENQADAHESFAKVQGELYQVGGEIARLEQTIKHQRELQQRQQQEYEETEASLKELEQHIVLDRVQVEDITLALADLEPKLKQAGGDREQAAAQLEQAETQARAWQERFDVHIGEAGEYSRKAEVEKTRINHLDQRIDETSKRLKQLQSDLAETDQDAFAERLQQAQQQREQAKAVLADKQQAANQLRENVQEQRTQAEAKAAELNQQQRQMHAREGRLESLIALQQAALNPDNDAARGWLSSAGLSKAGRLAEALTVDPQWQQAVELVLAEQLDGLLVADSSDYLDQLQAFTEGQLGLLDGSSGKINPAPGSLAEKAQGPDLVLNRLNQVLCADDIQAAADILTASDPQQSVITPRGEWLGHGWVRVRRGSDDQAGVLQREQEIRQLQQELTRLQGGIQQAQREQQDLADNIRETEAKLESGQEEVQQLNREFAAAASRYDHLKSRADELSRRYTRASEDQQQLAGQLGEDEDQVRQARHTLEGLLQGMADLQTQRQGLDTERQQVLQQRDVRRKELQQIQERYHDLALQSESKRSALESLQQSLSRMDNQAGQLQQRFVQLSEQIAKAEAPEEVHQKAMDALLQQRIEIEQRLAEARAKVQALEAEQRDCDAQRQKAVQAGEMSRSKSEQARLSLQESQFQARNLEERLVEYGQQAEALAKELEQDADMDAWRNQLEVLQKRITALEPVNLAAIQEYDEEFERKEYLDSQYEDLMDALATLESAIEKIDRKTRTRFKETFERVNKGVEELFPRLFGGGHAYLELTGEDLLTTGVSIMARPPGKRVTSIHLLSGGEKALTAVAFVFAIFQLNPAPFCLLDEVDAPLDDANVSRFSDMVREMSENVQFIVVTHNKITMEMVYQLCGVTMREPGVSRLVSVDIDQAARMAAS